VVVSSEIDLVGVAAVMVKGVTPRHEQALMYLEVTSPSQAELA
jgi:hypothetical protein